MSRWVRFAFIFFGVGLGSNLAADVITQPLSGPSDGFLSVLETGDRNAILTSLWLRIEKERDLTTPGASRYSAAREIERPTVEQSITWAASQADGPIQALAMFQMPQLDEDVPLLVDFRNRNASANVVGSLANVTTAFLGETPEPASSTLILPTLALLCLIAHRRAKPVKG
ncbi:MAG: hypothetical protein U0R19_21665 [Bryobacteraceae bacterium]